MQLLLIISVLFSLHFAQKHSSRLVCSLRICVFGNRHNGHVFACLEMDIMGNGIWYTIGVTDNPLVCDWSMANDDGPAFTLYMQSELPKSNHSLFALTSIIIYKYFSTFHCKLGATEFKFGFLTSYQAMIYKSKWKSDRHRKTTYCFFQQYTDREKSLPASLT